MNRISSPAVRSWKPMRMALITARDPTSRALRLGT